MKRLITVRLTMPESDDDTVAFACRKVAQAIRDAHEIDDVELLDISAPAGALVDDDGNPPGGT